MSNALDKKVSADVIAAMKEKNAPVKAAAQMLSARFKNEQIAQKRPLDEEEMLALVRKERKQVEDSLADAKKAGRDTGEYEAQWTYLSGLLPAEMGAEEVAAKVAQLAQGIEGGKGAVMKAVMPALKGKAEGKLISDAVDAYIKKMG